MSTTNLQTLYKIDSTGKVRQWTITCYYNGAKSYYEVEHGVKGGAMVSSRTNFTEGKNIGRANETTAEQQCLAEAKSLWLKQIQRKGYSRSVPLKKKFSPMLAKSYNKPGTDINELKDGKKIQFPCYYQPKLDGIRCIASKDSGGNVHLHSRQNKEFTSLPHIQETLSKLDGFDSNLSLDGELYTHGEEFQELTSAIKRDEPSEDSKKVQYHVYDVYDHGNPDWPYNERMKWLDENIQRGFRKIKPVHTGTIHSRDDVEEQLHAQIKRGYEGMMLRNVDGVYKVNGRSSDLQKVKLFIDEEFPIVDAYENKGKMEGQCTFVCETDEGARFGVKPEGDDVLRRQYWDDWQAGKLNGAMLTVRFFAWTTSDNPVPRFPVGVTIRDYE